VLAIDAGTDVADPACGLSVRIVSQMNPSLRRWTSRVPVRPDAPNMLQGKTRTQAGFPATSVMPLFAP
jgi:hypothetical protein